jgi:hypothetical protein
MYKTSRSSTFWLNGLDVRNGYALGVGASKTSPTVKMFAANDYEKNNSYYKKIIIYFGK